MSKFLSVVIPVYNEEGNIPELCRQVTDVLRSLDVRYEILLVDDGSNDGTWSAICEGSSGYDEIEGIRLSRNFGHQHALLAGLSHARGDAVISMDGDLQHPPQMIPSLFEKGEEGFDIVNTVREDDATTSRFKKMTSSCFYKLFSSMTGVGLTQGSSDFRLIDARVLEVLFEFRDVDIFLRGAVQWLGFRCATVPYNANRRFSGKKQISFGQDVKVCIGGRRLLFGQTSLDGHMARFGHEFDCCRRTRLHSDSGIFKEPPFPAGAPLWELYPSCSASYSSSWESSVFISPESIKACRAGPGLSSLNALQVLCEDSRRSRQC